jgi:assimilatory nitrate reductase catalytic subunit
MSSAVAAHKRAFGEDLVPGCYEDLELADLIILTGSNTAWCHPVLFQRIRAEKQRRPELRIVVVDPRRTATCEIADLHLPIAAGQDTVLFNALLVALADDRQACDLTWLSSHTSGFADTLLAARTQCPDLASVAEQCGLPLADLETFISLFINNPRTVTLFSQGINQSGHGVDNGNAIINCHLATARIGKPGAGPFSLTGQPNAMGGREVGGLANMLAAHLELQNPDHRALVADFWQVDAVPDKPGLKAVDLFDAIHAGRVKAIWIMATNPVVSLPDADRVRDALSRCELVVVSDCIADTDTTRMAHVLLPAHGWGEKDGTVTNSERCISRQRAFVPAAGESRPDWWAISGVAQRMGWERQFAYQRPVDIFREHAALSGYRNTGDCKRWFDISALDAIDADSYETLEPFQWPLPRCGSKANARLFGDGVFAHADGRARFVPVTTAGPRLTPTVNRPLWLNTGRIRDQWHTMTRTGLTARLTRHLPEPFGELHPETALTLGIRSGDLVAVKSDWGQAIVRAAVTADQQPGSIFVPMHWTSVQSSTGRVGPVVNPVVDPLSGQPESKHTPVSVTCAELPWRLVILARNFKALPNAPWAVRIREQSGVRLELAFPGPDHIARDQLVSMLPAGDPLFYRDNGRGIERLAVVYEGRLEAIMMSGPEDGLPAREWMMSMVGKSLSPLERRTLLSGEAADPDTDPGRIVCACWSVGEKTLRRTIAEKGLASAAAVGECLKAGTQCGSCQSEIATMLVRTQNTAHHQRADERFI